MSYRSAHERGVDATQPRRVALPPRRSEMAGARVGSPNTAPTERDLPTGPPVQHGSHTLTRPERC